MDFKRKSQEGIRRHLIIYCEIHIALYHKNNAYACSMKGFGWCTNSNSDQPKESCSWCKRLPGGSTGLLSHYFLDSVYSLLHRRRCLCLSHRIERWEGGLCLRLYYLTTPANYISFQHYI